MFVFELIKQCSPEKIAEEAIRMGYFDIRMGISSYKKYINESGQIGPVESDEAIYKKIVLRYKKRINETIQKMSELLIHRHPNTICGVIKYKDTDLDDRIVTDYDVFCFQREDLKKYRPGMLKKVKCLDEIKENPINPIQTYCFMFEDWKDILGYQMSEVTMKLYPKEEIIAAIIYELTWFGYDYETSCENRNKEISVLDDRMNYDSKKCSSVNDLFDQLEAKLDSYYNETQEERLKRKESEKIREEVMQRIRDSLIVENYNEKIDYWNFYYSDASK